MANYVIPTIGSKGFFTLKEPFSTMMVENEQYTCQSIRALGDYINFNDDPLNNIYLYYGLSEDDYAQDVAENMMIISLQSENGQWLYVPARYFISFAIQNGIVYQTFLLGVSLGAIPIDTDLTPLIDKISNVVYQSYGVTPSITPVAASKKLLVSREDHDSIQTARLARVSITQTDYGRYLAAVNENTLLREQISKLEAYIKEKHLNP